MSAPQDDNAATTGTLPNPALASLGTQTALPPMAPREPTRRSSFAPSTTSTSDVSMYTDAQSHAGDDSSRAGTPAKLAPPQGGMYQHSVASQSTITGAGAGYESARENAVTDTETDDESVSHHDRTEVLSDTHAAPEHTTPKAPEASTMPATEASHSKEKVASSSSSDEKNVDEKGAANGNGDDGGDDDGKKDHVLLGGLEDSPELQNLTEEQRAAVMAQIEMPPKQKVSFFGLFRYTTQFEIMLNALGLFWAICAGVAQPAMTIIFGNLTTSFVDYGSAVATAQADPSNAANSQLVSDARDRLFSDVYEDIYILIGIGVGMAIATYIYQATWIYTGEAATRRIRQAYLASVLNQNIAYFDVIGSGEITTRIQSDTHLIQEGISNKVAETVFFIAIFIAGIIIAFVRQPRLAGAIFSIVPIIAIAGGIMNTFISRYKKQSLDKTAEGGSLAEEVISSVRTAVAFQTQGKLVSLYDIKNVEALLVGLKTAIVNGLGLSVFFFVIYSSYGLAFYYGGVLIIDGTTDPGAVINVFLAILIGAFSLAQIAPNLQSLAYATGAAEKLFHTIDRIPVIDASSHEGLQPEHIDGTLSFEHVDFIYPGRPGVQVLYDFNAVFPKGLNTALVGGSGSGKSTCIGLIQRWYNACGGVIKLDGVPLNDYNIKWLRSKIGLVSQEPTLFAGSVAQNIAHGLIGTQYEHLDDKAKRERIIDAARQANADGFISALPEGYDTLIGERGGLLSGGQKQRVAIARAIVGNPPILLLDEATSALDTASEGIVQDALDRASRGRCTITIAHRLSTIKQADQIIVLTAGHILERAQSDENASAHRKLLENRDGPYSRLVTAQRFREENEGDAEEEEDEKEEREASELGKDEKPQFEALKKTGTGRSAASIALSAKHKRDVELGLDKERKQGIFRLFCRILYFNREEWFKYLIGFIASVILGCVYPVFGIVFGGFVGVFNSTDPQVLSDGTRDNALYAFIIAIVASFAVAAQGWAFGDTSERLGRKLRLATFAAILRQDIAYFDREENSTGALTSNIADWAVKTTSLFSVTLGVIIQSVFTLISGAIIGLAYAWQIALVGLACIPLTLATGIVRLRVVVLKDEKVKKSHAASAQMACEAASAIRTVASLTREKECYDLYCAQLDGPQRESNNTAVFASAFYAISQALVFWVLSLIFWWGVTNLVDGRVGTREFYIALMSVIFGSIQAGQIFNFVPDVSHFAGAANATFNLLDAEPEIDADSTEGEKLENCEGHVRFNNVHFRYTNRPHVPVLRGLNIEVKPGQFVALVGPSGCGKSTAIGLAEFYDPMSGTVTMDGKDLTQLNVTSYRSHVALVSQEPTLYAGTVRFNIVLGHTKPESEITDEEIHAACRKANIHDYIMGLPDAYDTQVGAKGTAMSGGQKQRISIARALIRNPKLLLLDEATSALDSESEKVVQKALDEAAKGRSTIAIAHRLSSIQGADVIYVIKEGRVHEKGTHSELMAQRGFYSELVTQQELEKQR